MSDSVATSDTLPLHSTECCPTAAVCGGGLIEFVWLPKKSTSEFGAGADQKLVLCDIATPSPTLYQYSVLGLRPLMTAVCS